MVRRIFHLTIEGKGPYDIARILFDDKIDTPAVYFGKQNKGVWKSKKEFPNPYNWSGYIVGQILSKPEYMGHTVNFRSHKQSYKDKNAVMNPKEDWLIFENTHEAIVDAETWELAQKLRKTPRRHDTLGEANPLTGLVFCADCGAKMMNHRSRAVSYTHLDVYKRQGWQPTGRPWRPAAAQPCASRFYGRRSRACTQAPGP